jgi:hypothetical protein
MAGMRGRRGQDDFRRGRGKPLPGINADRGRSGSDATTETPVTKRGLGGRGGLGALAMGAIRALAAAFVLAIGGLTAPPAAAAGVQPVAAPLPAGDQQCLACHGMPGLEKPLSSGEKLSLHIDGDHFAPSVHSALGCAGCHSDVNLASHPPADNSIASKRAFSIAMVQICRTCHEDEFTQWSTSVHAALAGGGNQIAPVCTSCHSPHTMLKGMAGTMDTVPCQTCHANIFTAYSASVHGVLRKGGLAEAPLCFSCHGAHDVRVPSAGAGRRDVCLGCHTEALASHRAWLPNVDLHFGVVSCPVCHVPTAKRVVDLILYNSATQRQSPGPVGLPRFQGLTDGPATPSEGLNPSTLMTLLTALNPPGAMATTSIKGRLELSTGIEDHELTFASKAIRECSTCHQEGASAFQSVVVSVAGPAGIPVRYDANKEVLNSALSLGSVGGFYAIGGSRVTFLDVLLVLALLGGIGGPLAHLTVRWAFAHFVNRTPGAQRKG